MSVDKPFTKENLDFCLKELAKELLLDFQDEYPGVLNGDNLADILKIAREKKQKQ